MSPKPGFGVDDRVAASTHVHCRQFDDELVMLDLATGQYFALEGVGLEMWQGLSAGKSPAEIGADLEPRYDVAQDVLVRDCKALAEELLGRGLLVKLRSVRATP